MVKERVRAAGNAPTLAAVAKIAGVSGVTVSRILRGIGPFTLETERRVRAAVSQVGYVPNRVAGSLASAGSSLIGVVVPSLSNIVFPEVLRGVNEALDSSGFQSVVAVTNYDPLHEEAVVRSILAWKPAAMIIVGFDHTDSTRKMLAECGVRVAELMDIDRTPIDIAVGLSHRKAGHSSALHLIGKGYRRFGYVGHDWHGDRRAQLRHDGLTAGLAEHGLTLAAQVLIERPSSVFVGRDGMAQLLAENNDVDVVVFSNDDMAVGGFFHCLSAGLRPKDDIGIFGFNGLDIGQALPIPLSTIGSDRYGIGKMAAEKILATSKRGEKPEIFDMGFEILEGGTA